MNRNPRHRLGAQRDAAELKDHIYFKTTDWEALARMAITPPFKPIVESDESTSNFDPEFTEADIKGVVDGLGGDFLDDIEDGKAGKADDLDEDDPSERWVERSLREGGHSPALGGAGGYTYHNAYHLANGPLGSDRLAHSGTSTPASGVKGIDIKRGKKDGIGLGGGGESPLTKSVQENFRGFTYHGGESPGSVGGLHGVMASRGKDKDAEKERERKKEREREEEGKGAITEEEYEDFEKSAGRYSEYSERRKERKESASANRTSRGVGESKSKKEKKKLKTVGFVVGDDNGRDGDLDVDGMVAL